jgi:GNAT superfamily N-acetyltransferase
VNIRRSLPEEAPVLTQIAHDAKRHWGYPEHWIEHWRDDLTLSADFITNNQVYVAESDGKIFGFYALVAGGRQAELEHMWVGPEHIGTGVGKELFIHAMQMAAADNISAIDISADPNAEGFYQRMGAQRIGEALSEIDGKTRRLPRLTIDPRLGPQITPITQKSKRRK